MSQSIDRRIVEMEFKNHSFENGIKESINSIDKLKQKLNFEGATKGLSDLENAGRSFSLEGIAAGLESVSEKFSAFGIMGITVLQNLTNRAIDLGIEMAKSLSVDQLTAGWSKYEQKTSSVQTIMNSTGKSIEEVNEYLNKLMWFSDETSYGFTDMTAALAQMTSSGGDIDNLIPLITGVANATAYAGKGAAEFSRAMYNLNQSYGAGALQYMDWKSLELAGVASQQLKEIFIETGKALGRLSKDGKTAEGEIVTIANFSQTLKDKWADTSVMEAAFGKFSELSEAAYQLVQAGEYDTAAEAMAALSGQYLEVAEKAFKSAQQAKSFTEAIEATKDAVSSGWMRSFELIFGNIEEATTFWTDVTNALWETFASGAEARNEMLSGWKDLGGRDSIIEALWNLVDAIRAVITPIKEAFRDIFPPMTAERLYAITEGIKEFTEKIKIGEKTSENLKNTFKGLFAIIDIGIQFFSAIGRVAGKFIKNILPVGDGLLSITGNIGKYITALDETIKKSDTFNAFFEKIGEILSPIIEKIKNGFKTIADIFSNFKDIDLGGVDAFAEKVETRFRPISKIFEFVGKIFETIADLFKKALPFVNKIIKAIGNTFKQISEKISLGDFNSVLDIFNTGVFATILLGIRKFIKGLGDITGEGKGVFENIKNIFGGLGDTLSAFQQKLKAGALLKIAAAIGVLAASLLVLSLIDSDKLSLSLEAITLMFIELFGSMAIFGGLTKDAGFKNIKKVSTAMISVSAAILVLSVAMTSISKLDWDEIAKGLVAITVLMGELVLSAVALSKVEGKITKTSIGLIAFSAALKILAGVVKDLGSVDIADLAKGLGSIGVLMGEILLFTKFADLDKMGVSKGVGLIALSGAISILANALAKLGVLDIGTLAKGVGAIGVLLGELILFINFTKDAKKVTSTAIGMTILATSMLIFSKAIAEMGLMPIEQIGKGLLTMGVALGEVVAAMKLLPKETISKAIALTIFGSAMLIFAKSIEQLGNLTWDEIAKGLVALAGALAEIVLVLTFLPQSSLKGSAAILVMAAAIGILTPCLKSLGSMGWEEIAKGLLTLAGAFTVIGLAGLILGPIAPAILALAGSITLLGIGIAAIGAGALLLSLALPALSIGLVAAGAAVVGFLDILITGLIDLMPKIGETFKAYILMLATVLTECLPTIVESTLQFIIAVLESLVQHGPEIVSLLVDLIVGLLQAIAKDLPRLINAAIEVIMAFFSGVVDALKNIDTDVLLKGIIGVGLISALVVALSAIAPLIPAAMLSVLGMAALVAEVALLLAAIGGLAQIPGLKWLIDEGGKLLQSVGTAIGSFIGGIVGGFMSGVSSQFPKIATDLSQFMTNIQPFIDGAKKIDPSVMNGIRSLADVILILTASTLLDGLTKWITGGTSVVTFGRELAQFGPYFSEYYESIKDIDGSVVQASANAAKALSEMAANLPNQGGLISWFTGENSITVFADELKRFGPSLKEYADSVKGIDPAVVQASANAAKTLSEMAKNLPNQGGLISWFTGENSISKFAEELGKFGPGMKEYADSVKGLDIDVVTSSANAAQALAEMAKNLPNQGGIITWFTGDNKLSVFSKELTEFGPSLKEYADSVYGLNPSVITNSANAAKALAELASNLPNQGGLISWFTGDNDLSSFGKKLAEFGKSFTEYYNSVYSIDTNKLYAISTELSRLIELAKGIKNVDTSGMSSFGKDLKNLGKSGIDEFIKAFTDANSKVKSATETLVVNSIDGANNKKDSFIKTFTNLVNSAISEFTKQYNKFKDVAKECITNFINGINDKKKDLQTSANSGVSNLITEIKKYYENFRSAGVYLVDGFVKGIGDNLYKAGDKGKELAKKALDAAKKELGVRSPSREFYAVGEYAGIGFVNALDDYNKKSFTAGKLMAENAKTGLNQALSKIVNLINNNLDTQPTIRPVLDLTNIQNGSRLLNSMFNQPYTLTGLRSMSLANAVLLAPKAPPNSEDISSKSSGNQEINNIFEIDQVVIREESDIKKVARELYNLQVSKSRG